jgi:hypothetical protein
MVTAAHAATSSEKHLENIVWITATMPWVI